MSLSQSLLKCCLLFVVLSFTHTDLFPAALLRPWLDVQLAQQQIDFVRQSLTTAFRRQVDFFFVFLSYVPNKLSRIVVLPGLLPFSFLLRVFAESRCFR